jgi:hypothetical protein
VAKFQNKGPSRRHTRYVPRYLSSYCLLLTRRSSLIPTLHLSIHAAQSTLSHTSNSHKQDYRDPSESTSCPNTNLATLETGTLVSAHSPKAQQSPHRCHFHRKARLNPTWHLSIALALRSCIQLVTLLAAFLDLGVAARCLRRATKDGIHCPPLLYRR